MSMRGVSDNGALNTDQLHSDSTGILAKSAVYVTDLVHPPATSNGDASCQDKTHTKTNKYAVISLVCLWSATRGAHGFKHRTWSARGESSADCCNLGWFGQG